MHIEVVGIKGLQVDEKKYETEIFNICLAISYTRQKKVEK